ncbi:MAG TPA: hypothetical protein VEG65_03720 [Candidatus Bathyarchaeia archaeon]|nr:hypothetical protein [Candidatus Bathyarchaeia archaeon]
MMAERVTLYYGRLVARLNELQAAECLECSDRLTCAVNHVLHPDGMRCVVPSDGTAARAHGEVTALR